VTINGIHVPSPKACRNVKLDAIPSDLVDMVEISKTLSANQDADAIGGSVNLVTKSATDKPYGVVLGMEATPPFAKWPQAVPVFRYGRSALSGQTRSWACCLGSYDYNARGIDDIEQLTRHHPWSPIPWTCVLSLRSHTLRFLAGRPTQDRRYVLGICAGSIPIQGLR